MFTVMQSMEIAQEIQADHRRRAATSRFARRHRKEIDRQTTVGLTTASVVPLHRAAFVAPAREVA